MSIAITRGEPFAAFVRTMQEIVDAWRGITPGQFGLAVLLGLASLAQVLVRAIDQSEALVEAINAQLGAFALLLAVVVADRAVDRGVPRTLAYGMAVLIGAAIGLAAKKAHMHYVWGWDTFNNPGNQAAQLIAENPRFVPTHIVSLYLEWLMIGSLYLEWLMIGGLATYVYADRREARQMAERLHQAQLQRNAQAKRVLESQLQAMQARVEPRFLFNTLAQVERLFESDSARAECMLDDLIAYLRAAMPMMRDTSSTVGQELELARAYLSIVKIRLAERLVFDIEAPPDCRHARMPPMMVLPLIDYAIAHGIEPAKSGGAIRIACTIAGGRSRLMIADSGPGFLPRRDDDRIAGIRERLAALYGDDARLELHQRERSSTEAVLEIPYETVEASADANGARDAPG